MRHALRPGDAYTVNAQAIEQIEIKIAFLERANAELSDVVFRQHRDIEALREQIGMLASRLQTAESDVTPRTAAEERPPHY
jgi:SlyX protein